MSPVPSRPSPPAPPAIGLAALRDSASVEFGGLRNVVEHRVTSAPSKVTWFRLSDATAVLSARMHTAADRLAGSRTLRPSPSVSAGAQRGSWDHETMGPDFLDVFQKRGWTLNKDLREIVT